MLIGSVNIFDMAIFKFEMAVLASWLVLKSPLPSFASEKKLQGYYLLPSFASEKKLQGYYLLPSFASEKKLQVHTSEKKGVLQSQNGKQKKVNFSSCGPVMSLFLSCVCVNCVCACNVKLYRSVFM